MSRFKTGDIARLNYRDSKASRYAENGRIATCVEYLGNSKWLVELENGRERTWLTADMDNVTTYETALGLIRELAAV